MSRPPSVLPLVISLCAVSHLGCDVAQPEFQPPSSLGQRQPDLGVPELPGHHDVIARGCVACHDPGDGSLSGSDVPRGGRMTYPANLTPDANTGLGGWSRADIVRAIRTGVDKDGMALCSAMPRYSALADDEVDDIVTYLQSLAPVAHGVPDSICDPAAAPDLSGMARPTDGGAPSPPDAAFDLATARDLASPDLASPDLATPDLATPDLATPDLGAADGGVCGLRINEIQTGSPLGAEDEFIELYNTCGAGVALVGITLSYRSATGDGMHDLVLATLPATVMPPGAYYVCAHASYTGTSDLVYRAGSIAAHGGSLLLRDANRALLDEVGWGDAANGAFHAHPAVAPAPGDSIERIPDGHSTFDDSRDLTETASPTPGATNR